MSVISAVFGSRDRQPGLNEARSPKLPYPALDSRQSAILFFTTLAGDRKRGELLFMFFLPMTAATTLRFLAALGCGLWIPGRVS